MAKFIPIADMWKRIRDRKISVWYDRLSFPKIMITWLSTIILFGAAYFMLSNGTSRIVYARSQQTVSNFLDAIYFSFITATSTGFGDILPLGIFKMVAIAEVVFGLVLLALVTSKMVSIKQDIVINEIYEISFHEKVNRIRSSLLVFRQAIGRVLEKVEDNAVRKRDVNELYVYLSSFENILTEVLVMMSGSSSRFKKSIDALNAELVLNSITSSFEKLSELLAAMNSANLDWRRDITLSILAKCTELVEGVFSKTTMLSERQRHDLAAEKDKVISELRLQIPAQPQAPK